MNSSLRRIVRVAFPLYVILVAFLSLTAEGPELDEGDDKWAHYAAYMVMALLGMPMPRTPGARAAMAVFVMTIGAALEVMQGWVPVRTPDPWDAVANVAGASMGIAVWWISTRVFLRE
jgi:VanZ family protein